MRCGDATKDMSSESKRQVKTGVIREGDTRVPFGRRQVPSGYTTPLLGSISKWSLGLK